MELWQKFHLQNIYKIFFRQMKIVKAVAPYVHPNALNFKMAAYEAWKKVGGQTAESHYPWRALHGVVFRWMLPMMGKNAKEVRLRFMEPVSMRFDTFPDYAHYELIPFVWDCWPQYFDSMCRFFEHCKVRTASFTSSQTAERMKQRFPQMNAFYIPEGIDTSLYAAGKELVEREIDLLEFGRGNERVVSYHLSDNFNHVKSKHGERLFKTDADLFAALANTKITIALPRCDTQLEIAAGIETLTQRYWESMLSRIVMVGRAPKELVQLLGYNPVIDIDHADPDAQMMNILQNISDYQSLVDRNRAAALANADWTLRMKQVRQHLAECGYQL